MPESTDVDAVAAAINRTLDSIEGKLNVLARAIGGSELKREWDRIEAKAGVPEESRTFRQRRDGLGSR